MGTVNIREERVELTAVDKSLSAVFRQGQGAVNQLRSSVDTVKNALAAVGLTVGAGAMLMLYKDTLKANAALDDMAEMTGASVENLSKLQTVAKIGGRDFDFDFVGESIGKMIKGLKGADEEGQNAGRALEYLGVKAKNADGTFRDTAAITTEVAKALEKYADGGNKVALVQDIYGKGAQKMLPYLKDLAEAGELNAKVTKEQAAQAEQAEKNLRRLVVTMEDGRRELVTSYTPALDEFLQKLIEASRITGGVISGGLFMLKQPLGGDVGAQLREVNAELEARRKGASGPFANVPILGMNRGIGEFNTAGLEQQREYLMFVQRQQALRLVDDSNLDARDLRLRQPKLVSDYESKGKEDKGAAARALQEAVFRAEKQVELEEMAATDSREAWEVYTKGRIEQDKAFKAGHEQMWKDVFKTIDDEQDAAIERGRELLEAQAEATKKATEEAERFAMTIDLAFDRAVRGGGDFLDILKELGKELAMIEIKKRFFEPASKGLSAYLDTLFKGGGASTSAAGGDMGMAGASVIGGPAYALGTDFVPRDGMAYLHRGERVLTAAQNTGGKVGGTYFIDARGADAGAIARLESMIAALHGSVERRAVGAVIANAQRGGAVARALGAA